MATALDRRKRCLSLIIFLALSVLPQSVKGYGRRRDYGGDYEQNSGYGGYGEENHYGRGGYYPKRYNNQPHYEENVPGYGSSHKYGPYGNVEGHNYEYDHKKDYQHKRRDTGYYSHGTYNKPHYVKDGLNHKNVYNYHHEYDLGDIILPLPKYHYIPKDESPIYPVREGYGSYGGYYDNQNAGYGGGNEGYEQKGNEQTSYGHEANHQPNYENGDHSEPAYGQNNYENDKGEQNGYEGENHGGYEQNGGHEDSHNHYQGETPHSGAADEYNGHPADIQGHPAAPQYVTPSPQPYPTNDSQQTTQSHPLNEQQPSVNLQQSEPHLPGAIPTPVSPQQVDAHPPAINPESNGQKATGQQERDQPGQNNNQANQNQPGPDLKNDQFNTQQNQKSDTILHNQGADSSGGLNQQGKELSPNSQNDKSSPSSGQTAQAQQESNPKQRPVSQGQPKEKPTPSPKERTPPGPPQCLDKSPFQENVTCSAWFQCTLNSKPVSARPASCWSETNADVSKNVFDPATQTCIAFSTLPGCSREAFCVGKSTGWNLLGGECTRIAYFCGDPQDGNPENFDDTSKICAPSQLFDLKVKQCVPERSIPQCGALIDQVIPVTKI